MSGDSRQWVNELLRQLGKAAGLSGAALDAGGSFSLSLDGTVFTLRQMEETGELYILHTLGALPEEREERARVSALLLERNCFFQGVGGGVLGVYAQNIYYTLRLAPKSLEYPDFERIVLAAADTCAKLKQEMEAGESAPAAAQEDLNGVMRV